MENYTFAVDNSAISAERAESNISTNTKDQSIFTTFKALDAIARLEPNDFAFVKRSTGTWQLAIVMEISDTYVYSDKYIKFLLDGRGHTKTIPAQQWVDMIRLEMVFSKKIEPTETCRSPYQRTSVASDTNKQLTKGTLGSRTSPGITRASSRNQDSFTYLPHIPWDATQISTFIARQDGQREENTTKEAKCVFKHVSRRTSAENSSHQRAFKSALISITHGSRSARARMA